MLNKILILAGILVTHSLSANAVFTNTLNGVNYKWLDTSATIGLSRDQVELRLQDPNDILHGYEYASRDLIADLFLSYSSWDGVSGWRGEQTIIDNISQLMNDLGATYIVPSSGLPTPYTTIDGYSITYDGLASLSGFYGATGECLGAENTCIGSVWLIDDSEGTHVAATQYGSGGWDASFSVPSRESTSWSHQNIGSFLVTTVPVPATAWLFGSALIGLSGIKRKK